MANLVKVKICGITRVEDALVALDAGADYLGFILYPPSPRAVSVERVAEIVTRLHKTRPALFSPAEPPLLVGVFVNESAATMAGILERCRLDMAQLSGDEEPQAVIDPASPLVGRAYKAIRPSGLAEAQSLAARYTKGDYPAIAPRPRLLLDTPHAKLYGGTGQTGDWSLAAELAAEVPDLMLAGGLNPDNVRDAVQQARPFGVDVAGGVEASPGIKDHDRVRAFINEAKAA